MGKIAVVLAFVLVAACTSVKTPGSITDASVQQPEVHPTTKIGLDLKDLPPPERKVDIAVYAYADKTGQQKPADNFSRFSKAVTQGADAILVDVLKDTANGHWFSVVERAGLNNLLNERNIIDKSRQSYQGATRSSLPPLRFAGIILEGGIINYDSNVITGGAGARYLAIGPSLRYRRDVLTVALRTVSVSTGEVLNSVTTTKTVYSTLVQGSVFRFVAIDELLELDAGFSRNEPVGFAVRQAIELAVYSLLLDGVKKGLWSFRDKGVESELLDVYEGRTSSNVSGYIVKNGPTPKVNAARSVEIKQTDKSNRARIAALTIPTYRSTKKPATTGAVSVTKEKKTEIAKPDIAKQDKIAKPDEAVLKTASVGAASPTKAEAAKEAVKRPKTAAVKTETKAKAADGEDEPFDISKIVPAKEQHTKTPNNDAVKSRELALVPAKTPN